MSLRDSPFSSSLVDTGDSGAVGVVLENVRLDESALAWVRVTRPGYGTRTRAGPGVGHKCDTRHRTRDCSSGSGSRVSRTESALYLHQIPLVFHA